MSEHESGLAEDIGPPSVRYEIIGRLADGAMGQVYLARRDDPEHSTPIVVKRIRPELQADPDIVLMFQDEARIASQLNHPNIVKLHEVGDLDGSLFLAMELVEGITVEHLLASLVKRRRFIPIEAALTIGLGVLRALHYAHGFTDDEGRALNIVHRDVSPQNVMVSYAGEVKLLDFGVTRAEGRLHQTLPGLLKGKLAYMAPEAIEGRIVDARADLFSLGAMLYEILLLKHPFFGSTDAMVLRSIVEEPPVHPREIQPEFPEAVADILLAALAKDPDHRVATADAMAEAIESYLCTIEAPRGGDTPGLGHYVRELYADRMAQHEQAKAEGDDMQLLRALRGLARHRFRRGQAATEDEDKASRGSYALPHSSVDLNYARVPTADLPVIRRTDDDATGGVQRASLEDLLTDAYRESGDGPRVRSTTRPLESTLGRYQPLEVLEQSTHRRLQRARLIGPHGFTKTVTLRRLPPEKVNDPDWIAPLVREAKLRADLNHPNIEALVDFDDAPEAFFAVEPLDGRRLDHVLNACQRGQRPPPPLGVALRIAMDIAEALTYLHGLPEPVLHRGVDPSAVMLYRTGHAKLGQFDVARLIDARVPYTFPRRDGLDRLAPEVVAPESGAEGLATDVYGMTLLLAECLTLTRPFLRDDPATTVQAILQGFSPNILEDVPPPVRAFVTRGTAVDPAYRFPNMAAAQNALLEIQHPSDRVIVRDWFGQR